MPHLTLEYTANCVLLKPASELFSKLHTLLEHYAKADLMSCKGRLHKVEDFYIGANLEKRAFVHLDIRLIEGRTKQTLQEVGQKTLECMQTCFGPQHDGIVLEFSVEFNELSKDTYQKSSL